MKKWIVPVIVVGAGAAVAWDLFIRDESWLKKTFGRMVSTSERGVHSTSSISQSGEGTATGDSDIAEGGRESQ